MSEPSYSDGDVVWVKWNRCWWPGEVWSSSRVPEDMTTSPKKPVIAYVKFFQEEAFEFVCNQNNIMNYQCDKKEEFIKKGMDKYRTRSKFMSNFPDDVVKAERLTGGDEKILENLTSPIKDKANTSIKGTRKSLVESSPVTETKKPPGAYNSASKVQLTSNSPQKSDKTMSCKLCDFATDRMNLLMIHMRNHSLTFAAKGTDSSPVEVKKSSPVKSNFKKTTTSNDSIADDVRKIKESLKPKQSTSRAKASRGAIKNVQEKEKEKTRSSSRKDEKEEEKPIIEKVEEKTKTNNDLHKLLADWADDDIDENIEIKKETNDAKEKSQDVSKENSSKPHGTIEKVGEPSRSIRNIPKKRISEVYKQPEIVKPKMETESIAVCEESSNTKTTPKMSKRKSAASEAAIIVENKSELKVDDESDEKLLSATAELLNSIEVPKLENSQSSSTFHESNDIDKKKLPPKERNKRMLRDNLTNESTIKMNTDNNGTNLNDDVKKTLIQREVMLPHKKKHSSRIMSPEKPSPVRETRNVRDVKQLDSFESQRTRRKRKSSDVKSSSVEIKHENEHEHKHDEKDEDEELSIKLKISKEMVKEQSPLREAQVESLTPSDGYMRHMRMKRRLSEESSTPITSDDLDTCSEPKKLHKSDTEKESRKIVACATEPICITSKGNLLVSKVTTATTTQANTVTVTSQVIITEATRSPIVATAQCSEVKSQVTSTLKISSTKTALKCPAENLIEMKKQGLVTTGHDKKNKLTEKGKQIYKEQKIKEKTVEATLECVAEKDLKNQHADEMEIKSSSDVSPDVNNSSSVAVNDDTSVLVPVLDSKENADESPIEEQQEQIPSESIVDESTNNNDIDKESIVNVVASPSAKEMNVDESTMQQDPIENGKEAENEASTTTTTATSAVVEDPNSSGAGLIAMQAETFGGPPNCFYLCRQIDSDRYEPVDNQILVLNAQNALVPLEGEIMDDPIASQDSNIIINTPSGQKIELSHFTIMALQEEADENGVATVELGGESLELNINLILEAISQQQDANETETLLPAAMLLDGETLILEPSELQTEIHHSATQVSETLSKPIMSTTVAPEITSTTKATISDNVSKNLNIEDSLASIGVTTQQIRSNVPKSLELPITVTNPTIAETVNHRKLANAPALSDIIDASSVVVPENFIVQTNDNNASDVS
ncbi:CLUMA_CG015053, isoform A [Clunio marinus]|uniref:CLUMA_CG015053, isoform A n=1 Tax=Clunio marinus TaxID=568069 RepID=A0A1J1IS36_9DIPT|nr:CLUMA_CG015053, isoform A [Clunio marinus]